MRITRLLALVIVFFLFSSPAFAKPQTSRVSHIMGIKDPNRALIAVSSRVASVFVSIDDSEPNKYGLNPTDLKSRIKTSLSEAGFRVPDRIPVSNELLELWISIEILKLEACGQCVINVETSLACDVHPQNIEEFVSFPGDVWKIESGLRAVAVDNAAVEINDIVQQQVQAFIAACPPNVSIDKKTDVNQPRQQLRKTSAEKDTKPAKQQAVEATFVASKNSDVFHKASCPSAQRISAKNLVSYATREEAIAAGKRPCERCNP